MKKNEILIVISLNSYHLCTLIIKISNNMKRISLILGIVSLGLVFMLSACKSRQKLVYIPYSDVEAIGVDEETVEVPTEPETEIINEGTEQETLKETFNLAEGNENSFDKTYHVVVGSFGIKNNAINLKNILLKEGNDALVVQNEQGMFRVIIASYEDYNSAHNKISKIEKRFADSWVLCQK